MAKLTEKALNWLTTAAEGGTTAPADNVEIRPVLAGGVLGETTMENGKYVVTPTTVPDKETKKSKALRTRKIYLNVSHQWYQATKAKQKLAEAEIEGYEMPSADELKKCAEMEVRLATFLSGETGCEYRISATGSAYAVVYDQVAPVSKDDLVLQMLAKIADKLDNK